MGTDGATGTSRMLWDNRYIYVLTEVKDPVLSKASTNSYEQDTVEVFFDENNHKSSSYESDDIQCRVNFDGEKTVTDGLSTDKFISSAVKTSNGYLVEMAIPSTLGGFTSGQVVGFDVQVNDDNNGEGKRTGIANWFDLTGMGYTDTSGFGLLKLTGDAPEPVTVYGDVNLDGKVSISDAVNILQYLANSEKYPLDRQAMINADVYNNGDGVTAKDAFTIQQVDAGVYTEEQLPVSYLNS